MNPWHGPICGEAGKRSREHVIPMWLRALLFDNFGNDEPMDVMFRFTRHDDPVVKEHSYRQLRPEVKVRDVCKNCNEGWMAKLEAAAKPILTPLVLGKPARLDIPAQLTIAHWAAKTVAMIDRYTTDSIVFDDGDIAEIRNVGAPGHYHVRLGYRPDSPNCGTSSLRPLT